MKKPKTNNPQSRRSIPVAGASNAGPTRPGGKLGLIIQHLGRKAGATADELAEVVGWQKHSILGTLSRLRARGFAVRCDKQGNRKTYRLER
jgi:hypothetical protein